MLETRCAEEMFDFVIVGAGAAGCVLANRLSARPNQRVLLLEAGASDRGLEVKIPAAFSKLFRSARDYAFDSVAQPQLAGRVLFWPRGKMLGGSSSMNAQMYVRGHRADYDGWAQAGCTGWSWNEVQRAFVRTEQRERDVDGLYGLHGPQRITEQRDPNVTTRAFLTACTELGMRRLRDINQEENEGAALTPVTQRRGSRFSAADAYLRPVLGRSNLRLITRARVARLVFEGRTAVGVDYTDAQGAPRRVTAAREVILAAGTIGSPLLLLRSGVGAAEQLRAHGIRVVSELASVGENLQDHLGVVVIRECPEPVTLVKAESLPNLLRYFLLRRGMLTSNIGEALALIRSRGSLPAPDLELIWAPLPFIDHGAVRPHAHGTSIGVVLLQPESRGRVRLTSADPEAPPYIDPGYLTDPAGKDLATLVAGVRTAQRLYRAPALRQYAGTPIEPGPEVHTDDQIAQFVREQAETLYHPVGSCRMGSDPGAVVDPTLRVRTVERLRIADASIMPRINRGHTYAPTIMIAERAAELILADAAPPRALADRACSRRAFTSSGGLSDA